MCIYAGISNVFILHNQKQKFQDLQFSPGYLSFLFKSYLVQARNCSTGDVRSTKRRQGILVLGSFAPN